MEISEASSNEPGKKMSRRQRKNKKNKEKRAPPPEETGQSIPAVVNIISLTTETLRRRLNMSGVEWEQQVSQFCLSLEDRILNGYPRSTSEGVFVFYSSSNSTLSNALHGCGWLLLEEFNKAEGTHDLNSLLIEHYESHAATTEEDGASNKQNNTNSSLATKNTICKKCSKPFKVEGMQQCWYHTEKQGGHSGNFQKSCDCSPSKGSTVEKGGSIKQNTTNSSVTTKIHICKRCSTPFKPGGMQQCWYHKEKKGGHNNFRRYYVCCRGVKNSRGCTSIEGHIYHQYFVGQNGPLKGYAVVSGESSPHHPILAVDCEMIFTTEGLELARVTLVEPSGKMVLDEYVKPKGIIRDFNTTYSGITARHLSQAKTFDVAQVCVLEKLSDSTVLVGHSLESDLHALKLIHRKVLDTAVLFRVCVPDQHNGASVTYQKRRLKYLVKYHLGRDIQTTKGHNPFEDSAAAMDLVLKHLLDVGDRSKVAPLPVGHRNHS